MKSMSELIQSVKDEKLKKVAEDLKEKLSNVGRTIAEKRKKGEQVTESESASLKKSLSGYVKKGLSATLVSAMLASMLSGCDVLLTEVERGTGEIETAVAENSGENVENGEEVFDSVYNIGGELFVDDEETYNNGLDEKYGMKGVLSEINFEKLLTETKYSEYLDLIEAKLQERCENNEAFTSKVGDGHFDRCVAPICQIANGEKGHVLLTSETDKWENIVLFTSRTLAVRTKNKTTGKLYLTGFVNGEFKNDLKIADERIETLAKTITEDKEGYKQSLASIQKEFWGMILRDAIDRNSKTFSGDIIIISNYAIGKNDEGVTTYDADLTNFLLAQDGNLASAVSIDVETDADVSKTDQIITDVRAQQIADRAEQQQN